MFDPNDDARRVLQLLRSADDPTANDAERVRRRLYERLGVVGLVAASAAAPTGVQAAATGALSAGQATAGAASNAAIVGGNGAIAGAGAGALAPGAVTAAAHGGWLLSLGKAGVVLSLVGTGTWFAATSLQSSAPPAASSTFTLQANAGPLTAGPSAASPAAASLAPSSSVPSGAQSLVVPPVELRPPDAVRPPATRGRAASSAEPALDEEVVLLSDAQRALSQGDHARALSYLQQHARRFPNGLLASEREASRAIALCKSGQHARGSALAKRYLSGHSDSPLAERVRVACQKR